MRAEQWVYSFERNAWAPLPGRGEEAGLATPYTQMVYVARSGVLVNLPRTAVMRPSVREMAWE